MRDGRVRSKPGAASFPISIRVVAQGQWSRVKRMVQAAVRGVQPWEIRRDLRVRRFSGAVRVCWFR